jgi:hypothetical protein
VPLSCSLGTLTSWNPLGHSRPVTGLLYLFADCIVGRIGLSAGLALPEFKHFSRQWIAPQTAGMKGPKRNCSLLSFGFENVDAMKD